jgi:hypothetical protein
MADSRAQAREALKRISQRLVRSAAMPLTRRYRADRMFENKHQISKVFANGSFFAEFYPIATKMDAGLALQEFKDEFGVRRAQIDDRAECTRRS